MLYPSSINWGVSRNVLCILGEFLHTLLKVAYGVGIIIWNSLLPFKFLENCWESDLLYKKVHYHNKYIWLNVALFIWLNVALFFNSKFYIWLANSRLKKFRRVANYYKVYPKYSKTPESKSLETKGYISLQTSPDLKRRHRPVFLKVLEHQRNLQCAIKRGFRILKLFHLK